VASKKRSTRKSTRTEGQTDAGIQFEFLTHLLRTFKVFGLAPEQGSRKKAGKTPKDQLPVRMGSLQRFSILKFLDVSTELRTSLDKIDPQSSTVPLTAVQVSELNVKLTNLLLSDQQIPSDHRKRLETIRTRVSELCDTNQIGVNETEIGGNAVVSNLAMQSNDVIFQLKITLKGIKPAIWRQIQIPDCTLGELHNVIQNVLGWEDGHLHQFRVGREIYGPAEASGPKAGLYFEDDFETADENGVLLSRLAPSNHKKVICTYEYDFGDGWCHEVLFEKFRTRDPEMFYPVCTAGARACPPEDCGGPWGYAEYLEAISDPQNARHDEMLEWNGPFDPEEFNTDEASTAMRWSDDWAAKFFKTDDPPE
jgi:hypothetical protein